MMILSDSEIYIDELKDDTVGYADGRTYVVRDGSTAVSNNKIMDGGSVRVEGQKVIGNTIYSNGLLYAMNASALYNVVSNGGQLNVGMSGYAEGNIIAAGGSMYIGPYTIAVSNYIQDGGAFLQVILLL